MSLYPIVSIKSQTSDRISDEYGFRQSVCTFVVNENVAKWEARAVLGNENPPRGVGTIVEAGGFLEKGAEAKIFVDFNELNSGDGLYTISIYAQDIFGYWSDGTFQQAYVGTRYNRMDSFNCGFKFNCALNNSPISEIPKDKYNTGKTFNSGVKFNTSKE